MSSSGSPSPTPDNPQNDESVGVGLSNPEISQTRRNLLDLINRLHSTGAQVDIDLPQIAVIGSQSAGKSSLIESISGITLPRASGTCTRCPTECRLSRTTSASWECKVSLRFITDPRGQTLGQIRNDAFGAIITDKSQVEERIRRAQRAILNPNTPMRNFLEGDDEDLRDNELTFSTNCVSLQISGPDVADLSFCDLPGLIASVSSGGKESDIKLVEGLVTNYISKPSCVILLTVACETDFENQGAHHLAKRYDPHGQRTIGVLTKPDRIPQGDDEKWISFIKNEREPLDNNWFCVKQPSSVDLKARITWKEARTREDDWFRSTSPWSTLDPMYQRYLRTSNLVDRLSTILSDLISKRLPKIQTELEEAMKATMEKLAKLPKEPSKNPQLEISELLSSFVDEVKLQTMGVPKADGIMQLIRPVQDAFRREIRATAPEFRPFSRKQAHMHSLSKPTFLRNEDGDDEGVIDDDNASMAAESGTEASFCEESPSMDSNAIYVDEVLTRAQHARTRELPGHYPFLVQASFIYACIEKWHAPSKTLCRAIHAVLADYVNGIVVQYFADYGQSVLEHRVQTIIQDHLKLRLQQVEDKIDWLYAIEDLPFTLNTHYFADYRDKFFAYYKGARQKTENRDLTDKLKNFVPTTNPPAPFGSPNRGITPPPNPIATALGALAALGIHGVDANDLSKLLPADPMEPAINIMADVRAYFQVAYKRFTDIIPLAVDHDLVRGLSRDLQKTLSERLGIYGPSAMSICRELAQESPRIASRREELLNKMERLRTASEELLNVGLRS